MTFQPGDRVYFERFGEGTVITVDGDIIGVCFGEEFPVGHSLGGLCDRGHGYWVSTSELRLIHRDGPAIDQETFLSLLTRKEDHP